jgi:hypothetical protein
VTVPDAGGAVVHKSRVVRAIGRCAEGETEVAARLVIIHVGGSLHRAIKLEKQHDGVIPFRPG